MDELKVIKDYFPKSYNKFTRMYGLVNSKNNKSLIHITDNELTDYIQTYTKGLNLKVNYIKTSEINAFTIPSSIDQDMNNRSPLIGYPIINDLYTINIMYYKLLKANIDGFTSNGITTFTHNLPDSFVLETYQTSRFFNLLSNDVRARFAVTLHEIGHWHDYNPYLISSLLSLTRFALATFSMILSISVLKDGYGAHGVISIIVALIIIINVTIFFMINYVRSINEENCDKFAKKLGYGEDSARAMFAFEHGSNDFNSSLNKQKFSDSINTFSFKIKDFIFRLSHGYPTTSKRIEAGITENILNLSSEIELKNIIMPIDQFFSR